MADTIKESERMKLICEFLKTGQQPEGFKVTETKTGKYRLVRAKNNRQVLEERRKRIQKNLDDINAELKKLDEQETKPDAE